VTEPSIGAGARIGLHRLGRRADGGEWIVGRMETGECVALPEVGVRALDLLAEGRTVGAVAARLADEGYGEVAVADFVRDLAGLGFVAEVDGRPVSGGPEARRGTFPWLRPRHVRWALGPAPPLLLAALLIAALAMLLHRPDLLPGRRDLLWSPRGSLVLALGVAAGWAQVLVHESAHLAVARAAGVPARVRLGTRLQFLVLQTDISGIELAPRRHRLTAYLAGIGVNLAVAAGALLCRAAAAPGSAASRLLAAVVLVGLLPLPFQCMVFMRTDVYFVLQDLTRCRDLYGDGRAYAAYAARRALLRGPRRPGPAHDPSRGLPAHERRAVRVYSAVLVAGTALCLAALATVTGPTDAELLLRAAARLGPGHPADARADGAVVLAALGGVHAVWAATWVRARRGRRRARL
jgi:hypothetical protein